MIDILSTLPARSGHFLLESGYHTDLWLTLDPLFLEPAGTAPLVAALADKLRPHAVTAICGPLLGGAFLAQALAGTLGARFYYTEPAPKSAVSALFTAAYRLPAEQRRRIRGERVAVVDDLISAGSSTSATIAAIAAADASAIVVGTLFVLGDEGLSHFASQRMPVETLGQRAFNLWTPADCPLCRTDLRLGDLRSA
jgi:orotate phosphoribosyltransferase